MNDAVVEPGTGEPLDVVISDGVAVITLNRPDARNAINGAMRRSWWKTMTDLEADPSVAVMILTGADPAFCAGLDLRELGRADGDLDPSVGEAAAPTASRSPFPPRTKPLIGAVNGPAITGGFELALNCDFLVASERARFADTHARVGVMPGWGLTPLLSAAVGVRRAREISLTGNFVTAEQALGWGLVNRVVAHDELLETTRSLAGDIAANDGNGVARMLATYGEQERQALADGWRIESEAAAEFRSRVGFEPGDVEARRQGIIDRGRNQL